MSAARERIVRRLPRRRARTGIALLMTLIVVVLYAIIASQFIYTTTVYSQLLHDQRDNMTAEWAARGGIIRARALLKLDDQFEFDSLNEDWAQPISYEEGDAPEGITPEVTVTDEERKFNVRLLAWDDAPEDTEQQIKEIFERLIYLVRKVDERSIDPGEDENGRTRRVEPRRASADDMRPAAIYDGIRRYIREREDEASDDATFEKGERRGRVRKQSPYSLITIRELLFAEDMTETVLMGREYVQRKQQDKRDGDGDGRREEDDWEEREYDPQSGERLSEAELSRARSANARVQADIDSASSPEPEPLEKYLTLWGSGRININTADRLVLLALSEHFTIEMVRDIIIARDEARQSQEIIQDGTEAEPVDDPVTGTDPLEEEGATEEEEDQASFRVGDIANVVAFYNRVYQNISEVEGEENEPITEADQVPEEWRLAFEDMQPFITITSQYFRVTSEVQIERTRKRYEAVFRRDRTAASLENNANGGNNAGNAGNGGENPDGEANVDSGSNSLSSSRSLDDLPVPPEPGVLLRLVFMNEVE